MSSQGEKSGELPDIPSDTFEQDVQGPGDDLPTYDDLAAQSGPNSRFGRWRGWIEKRAAERYQDVSPEERERRRARGWGNDPDRSITPNTTSTTTQTGDAPITLNQPPTPTPTPAPANLPFHLRIHTELPSIPPPTYPVTPPESPPPFPGILLQPSNLRLNQFGSRFLHHAETTIHCVLPILGDRLLLVGHDEGLSVLDMFPQEWSETGQITHKGPDEAQARVMWVGEAVHQMSILEIEGGADGTPQGVVLALVGAGVGPCKDPQDMPRTLRMYNYASLLSLAKWSVAQKGVRPVDLNRMAKWDNQQTPVARKHRSQHSITKGLRSLIIESPGTAQSEPHTASYQSLMPANSKSGRTTPTLGKGSPASPESAWDLVEDLPIRWATDFVTLAAAGSRLVNTSVLSYALWRDGSGRSRGSALLAVATKSNILLYEKPKGERAFRFIKEFYTPLQPRKITFVQQSVQDIARSASDAGTSPQRHQTVGVGSSATLRPSSSTLRPSPALSKYSHQLSIFVVFDKKAGSIRIADSAVAEVDMAYEPTQTMDNPRDSSLSSSTGRGRSRNSDFQGPSSKGAWSSPVRAELPGPAVGDQPSIARPVYFITRGKRTQIVPCPLPAIIANTLPLTTFTWESQPSHVTPRLCHRPGESKPFLQLVALGEDGIEVQEVSLSFMVKGKGKGRTEAPVRASMDINGDAGFLSNGGHWHKPDYPNQLARSHSVSSDMSSTSFDSLETEELAVKMQTEQGLYGWCQKGLQDWRVFWVGGSGGEGEVRSLNDGGKSDTNK